jgi:hypothetical protein
VNDAAMNSSARLRGFLSEHVGPEDMAQLQLALLRDRAVAPLADGGRLDAEQRSNLLVGVEAEGLLDRVFSNHPVTLA